MKKLIIALLLFPCFAFAQYDAVSEVGLPIKDGLVVYERVVDVKGMKKSDIYAASKKWITDNFNSSKRVIQTEDYDAGQLIGDGSTTAKVSEKNRYNKIEFKLQINCKDEKYRIRFYQMNITAVTSGVLTVDLRKTNSTIPLETLAFVPKDRKFSEKDIEKVKTSNKYLNDHFTLLLNSFNNSVRSSTNDDF